MSMENASTHPRNKSYTLVVYDYKNIDVDKITTKINCLPTSLIIADHLFMFFIYYINLLDKNIS